MKTMRLKSFLVLLTLYLVALPAGALSAQDAPSPGDLWTEPVTGMEFVWIPGGEFEMGQGYYERLWLFLRTGFSGEREFSVERPRHSVTVSGYWMGRWEVKNGEFRKYRPTHDSGEYEGQSLNADDQPVVKVSWDDAVAFARWLSEKGNGTFLLPTEAQWEYGVRGNGSEIFPWGNDAELACAYANVADRTALALWPSWTIVDCDDRHAVSTPAGTFAANSFGLYDMTGNVWEWCRDAWKDQAYRREAVTDPVVEAEEGQRVARGGSWGDAAIALRSSYRRNYNPDLEDEVLGFRLVWKPAR